MMEERRKADRRVKRDRRRRKDFSEHWWYVALITLGLVICILLAAAGKDLTTITIDTVPESTSNTYCSYEDTHA